MITLKEYIKENTVTEIELVLEETGPVIKKGIGFSKKQTFNHKGQTHTLETKTLTEPFGKLNLKYNGKYWDIDPASKQKYPETSKAVTATGVLKKINSKWGETSSDKTLEKQKGDVKHSHPDADPIKAMYGKDKGISYLQVNDADGGFYHTGQDAAQLGSPEIAGKTELHATMKGTKTGTLSIGMSKTEKSHHDLNAKAQEK